MDDTQYNLQFEKLCDVLQLGKMVGDPEAIHGGHLHKMYALQTTLSKYAIKALNPQIMLRPIAKQNFIISECITNIVAKNIPAIGAKKFNCTSLHEIDKQFYLVFDWVDGKILNPNETQIRHSEKIATILADIHMTDFSKLGLIDHDSSDELQINWNFYLQKGLSNNSVWLKLLRENIDSLYDLNTRSIEAAKLLASDAVISHRDLDPKNVMWNKDSPIIIDWEATGFINPLHDLIETAIYWSKSKTDNIDKDKFLAFLNGYKRKAGIPNADWRAVLYKGFSGKFGWLEYSLKRSLWIECSDEAEQQMGTEHVTDTIKDILQYADMITRLEKWLAEI